MLKYTQDINYLYLYYTFDINTLLTFVFMPHCVVAAAAAAAASSIFKGKAAITCVV